MKKMKLLRRPDSIVGGRSSDLRRSVGTQKEKKLQTLVGEVSLGLIFLISLAGCSEGTIALKELARNQQAMEAEVNAEKQLFDWLKKDLQNNRINKKTTKQIIVDAFGEPLFCRNLQNKAAASEVCVFRSPANGMYSDILYLYFDEKQNFDSWKFEPSEIP